jgi:site-specific recombinase XerD
MTMPNALISQEDPEFSLTTLNDMQVNPAYVYLMNLMEGASRRETKFKLEVVARYFGFPNIDVCPWTQITTTALAAFKADWERKGKSPNTINAYLSAIRGVIRTAWSMNQLSSDRKERLLATKGVRGSRVAKGRELSALETNALIEACIRDKNRLIGSRDAALISMGLGFGLRRAELAEALIKNINWEKRVLIIRGKGSKEREIVGSEIVWTRLESWLALRGADECPYIFLPIDKTTKVNKPLNHNSIFYILQNRAKQAGIKNISVHDLRRTFASRMLRVGADISILKEAMGHESIETTALYDKRGLEEIRDYSQKIII